MSRKNILIINSGVLFPKVMAFQDRVINMTKCLNEKHNVDIICLYTTVEERKYNQEHLAEICNRFYLIKKPNNTFIKRKLSRVLPVGMSMIFGFPLTSIESSISGKTSGFNISKDSEIPLSKLNFNLSIEDIIFLLSNSFVFAIESTRFSPSSSLFTYP